MALSHAGDGRSLLSAADGSPLASFGTATTGDVRWLTGVTVAPGADPNVVATALLAELPGHRAETEDDALVTALVARGGRVQRRAHDYVRDLTVGIPDDWAEPALPAGWRLAPASDAAGLAGPHAAAYPVGHPDHNPDLDHARELDGMITGKILGPLVPEASWQAERVGVPRGAAVVVNRPAFGEMSARLWLIELFLHPDDTGLGIGTALLRRSLAGAAAAGHQLMGLVVSDGNPARELYEKVGFTLVMSGTSVDLPG